MVREHKSAAAQSDLSGPHPVFSKWTREETYDRITAMFVDSWSSDEVAAELSRQLEADVTPAMVDDVRIEASTMAEAQDHSVRLRWIYRFPRLTLNNLVKEYMFLEGKKEFLKAKRELAEEIEALVKNTPPARLCIAVNDALGRNNIGYELLEKLQQYAQAARKMDNLIRSYAATAKLSSEDAFIQAAHAIGYVPDGQQPDKDLARAKAAQILKHNERLISDAELDFLAEFGRIGEKDKLHTDMAGRIAHGADLDLSEISILDSVLDDTGVHLAYEDLRQLAETMRSGTVMHENKLRRIHDYATRHLKDMVTLQKMGRKAALPEQVQKLQLEALKSVEKLAEQHMALLDHRSFFTTEEFSRAAAMMIPPRELQMILDRVNALGTAPEARAAVAALTGPLGKFQFPMSRYEEKRFKLPAGN